jgi:hypothetical protein
MRRRVLCVAAHPDDEVLGGMDRHVADWARSMLRQSPLRYDRAGRLDYDWIQTWLHAQRIRLYTLGTA